MEFEDRDAFEAWLKGQSQEICVAIATRAALRVWPVLWADRSWQDTEKARAAQEKFVLLTGWCNLISGAVSTYPTPEIKTAAATAATKAAIASADGLGSRTAALLDAADAGRAAANAAARATPADAVSAATYTAATAAAATAAAATAAAAAAAADAATYADCGRTVEAMFAAPLWHEAGPPEGLRPEALGPSRLDRDPRFDFFRRWYDGMTKGLPMDWDLQSRVALIPETVWKAGADEVAEAIAQIEALFAVRQALGDLAQERAAAHVEGRHGIGGNNPPEEIDAVAEVRASQTIIWAAVEEIAEEVEAKEPDKTRVARALEAIKAAFLVCAKWAGKKADLAIDTAIKDGIGVAIKSGAALYGLGQLIQAVEAWLPFLK
ncbi:hypothetical protein [Sagittula sp. S175]|uniref:hypothetical protein n=1 Tax=Sagittula sp. S175 TaxID=3415129 RepID=UPI003C7DBEDA